MNLVFGNPTPVTITDQIQSRLLRLAALFLFLYCLALSLSPVVRLQSWSAGILWEHWLGFAAWMGVFLASHRSSARLAPERDPYILPAAALLSGLGLLTIWRLDTLLGLRQSIWLVICGILLVLGLRVADLPKLLRQHKYLWLVGGLLLTSLTFIFGTYPSGAGPRLWLGCCGVYFQPSEPLKLLLVIYLAAYLADQILIRFSLFSLVFPTLALTGVAAVLLVAQRDLGTAVLFLLLYSVVIYTATGQKRVMLGSFLAAGLFSIAGYFAFDVVRQRMDAWISPWQESAGRGYQIVQSLIGTASGGIFGRGPGLGSPGLVPVSQSDFIFTAIAEEMGLFGTIALILLIALLVLRGLRAAFRAPDPYQRYLATGLSAYLALQSILIIGGNLRMLPLTGVTLPFVSYGGSSLLTSFISLLLLLQVSNHPDQEPLRLPRPNPYLHLAAGILLALGVAGILDGWWGFVQSANLQSRADNPRQAITDLYVRRGSLLDRNYTPLATTQGSPGDYQRVLLYPELSPILGYANFQFGRTGLEASLDPYLRGIQGNPGSLIAWTELTAGQPPPGLDVRLSLDINLQRKADALIGSSTGGLVVLNASTGEILAMASSPGFNANQLDKTWPQLIKDPASPLLNRAVQGQYPPGTVLGPFLLLEAAGRGDLPALPDNTSLHTGGQNLSCALPTSGSLTWGSAAASGCPAALALLGRDLGTSGLIDLFTRLGFYSAPKFELPASSHAAPTTVKDAQQYAIGMEGLAVSPLQMALAAAGLSNNGSRPAPRMAISVQQPGQGWVILPARDHPSQEFQAGDGSQIMPMLAEDGQPVWSAVGAAPNGDGKTVSWFIGGTLADWKGTPVAVAIVLDTSNSNELKSIGDSLIQAAMR